MKIFNSLKLFFVLLNISAYGQEMGGLYLPSEGEIKTLIVFVQFPDDGFIPPQNEIWPKGGNPKDMEKWLDPEWTGRSVKGSLTNYFNIMSLGKLKVTGEEVSVTTLNTREWYIKEGWSRYQIHRQIIEQQLDPEIDFTSYDNWTVNKKFSLSRKPDGKIDFVFFIWRNIDMDFSPQEISTKMKKMDMGWIGSLGNKPLSEKDSKVMVDDKARYFEMQTFGSGCTVINYFFKDPFRFAIHEFAHYLLGGNGFHNGHAFWAMLSGYEVRTFMINAWERHRLGWGEVITIPRRKGTLRNLELSDFITTGKAYRIEIDSASNQYFFLENHQGISEWDKFSKYPEDKGVYVIRQDALGSGFAGTADWMTLITAEGKWNWEISRWVPNKWGAGELPVFRKTEPDRDSGYLATEFRKITPPASDSPRQQSFEIIFTEDDGGVINEEPLRVGTGADAFRPGNQEVFSQWSNPASQNKKGEQTGIGFYLKELNNGKAVIDIFFDNASEAPPSKPQGLQIIKKSNRIELTWQPNNEPDVLASSQGYEIEMSTDGKLFTLLGRVNGKTTQYVHNSIPPRTSYYRIIAKDTQNLRSVPSGVVSLVQ